MADNYNNQNAAPNFPLVSSSEVEFKIRKYEDKIDWEMRPQLHHFIKKRDLIYEELAQYLQLKNVLEMLQEQKLKKFESRVDLGCNIFITTEVEKDIKEKRVMVALSKDFFVELSWDEALPYIEKKEKLLNAKAETLTRKVCEVKAHILFV